MGAKVKENRGRGRTMGPGLRPIWLELGLGSGLGVGPGLELGLAGLVSRGPRASV